MSRRNSSALILAGLIATTSALAAVGIMSLLPPNGVIGGWTSVAGADRKGCTAQDFYSMYDGAAPAMMQAGITAAGARVYHSSGKRLTVDLYRFRTLRQAKVYYGQRKGEIADQKTFRTSNGTNHATAFAVCGRTYVSYLWRKQYCCTMSVNGASEAEKAALAAFATHINRKIAAQP